MYCGGMTALGDLDTALSALASELREERERLVDEGLEVMRVEMPEFFVRDGDPDFVETYRRSYEEQLRFLLDGMGGERALDGCDPPTIALWEARMTAARGIPLAAIQHGYRITHRLLLDEVLRRAVEGDVLREASRWLFTYFDWIAEHASAAYDRERTRLVRDRDERRRRLVEQVLDGQDVDAGALGYDLAGTHTAVIVWGPRAAEAVAVLGGRTLEVPGTETTRWVWIAARTGSRRSMGPSSPSVPRPPASRASAAPTVRPGRPTGSRARPPLPCTHHADVALPALALHDRAAAHDFVLRELGPLAGWDQRHAVLRDTLVAYFASGDNGAAAARTLGVHERTITYRLRRIEDELGFPVRSRRDELAVAVRLAPFVVRG